ncbi:SDR family oxidoreductase [Fulvivirga sp. M361]|uniref:SDR family oxidoreductase n=1 Tax=Fulvivirga sp. M361 TaxID=2594266 RepID=UPI00117A47D9|nr:SDR family oxidoreductase [Fulvivirga sp. M361]TRX61268.1 SDR family oxidoreductase [Fulvivirga sp. M361]
MNLDFTGKRAIVCGSTQGIGKATAIELARLGADITLIARNETALQGVKDELANENEQDHHYVKANFDQPKSLQEALSGYIADLGEVHVLVNNSGGPPAGMAIDADLEEFRVAFNRHLICNQIMAQTFVPLMKAVNYGRIINVISTSVKAPINGLGVSNTIRGGVASWAKTLANELGPYGITVNNVLPGATMTARLETIIKNNAVKSGKSEEDVVNHMKSEIPARRFAEPEEVAAAITFLASPAAGYINGINVPVDGGRLSCL